MAFVKERMVGTAPVSYTHLSDFHSDQRLYVESSFPEVSRLDHRRFSGTMSYFSTGRIGFGNHCIGCNFSYGPARNVPKEKERWKRKFKRHL